MVFSLPWVFSLPGMVEQKTPSWREQKTPREQKTLFREQKNPLGTKKHHSGNKKPGAQCRERFEEQNNLS